MCDGRNVMIKFDYDLCDGKVNRMIRQLCLQWEPRIKTYENFFKVWVSSGSESLMKGNVKKHSELLWHREAYKHQ